MTRVVLTMLLLTFSFGVMALTTFGANATRQTPALEAPEACPEPDEGADQVGMDDLTDVMRLEGPEDSATDSEYFFTRSVICFETGASVPSMRYDFTYYLFVQMGELTVNVSEIGSETTPEGQALVYRNNVYEEVVPGNPVTLSIGDAIFLANVEASFENAAPGSTEVVATGVIKDGSPNCATRCWLP